MSAGFWVVVQTKPQQEQWAAENVARQGFDWYLPLTPVAAKKPGKPSKIGCLFPRYLFVWTQGRWHSLLGTFGITAVVMNGPRPSILPEKAIESLRAREDHQGIIRLPNALEVRFQPDTEVRVNGGVFSGYRGLYSEMAGEDRSKVLLEFLGQKATVLIPDEFLEPV